MAKDKHSDKDIDALREQSTRESRQGDIDRGNAPDPNAALRDPDTYFKSLANKSPQRAPFADADTEQQKAAKVGSASKSFAGGTSRAERIHDGIDTPAETKADVIEETRPKGGSLEPAHPKPTPDKPTPESVATPQLVGPMLLGDVQSALSDRYPHNDIHTLEGKIIEVKVPTGVILVDFAAVNKCKNNAELRAYIDSLPVQ